MATDPLLLGRRIRHARTSRGLTLDALGDAVGAAPSQLSQIENGRREPRLSLLQGIAEALGVGVASLLADEAPSRRDALEIELDRAQRRPAYAALGLPSVKVSTKLPGPVLESLVGLHGELARRESESISTPEEARRANTAQRLGMQARNNYLPGVEDLAEDLVRKAGYTVGALTHRTVAVMASQLGFELVHVNDLPPTTRTVTDLQNGRIYLPASSIPGGHGLRSLALQAIAHRVLGHERPASYAEFLDQRSDINYFAAACLVPRFAAAPWLEDRKRERDLAVEDFRDAFGVTHEAAARRFTNLATEVLGLPCHFLRVQEDGSLYRGYENDGVPLRADVTGAIEGQPVCRWFGARAALHGADRTTEWYQYSDTPVGTYWCSTQAASAASGGFTVTIGVPFAHSKWFRGRDTSVRRTSTCPDDACCRRPSKELLARWGGASWPSARMRQHVFGPLPTGAFPGVDQTDVYQFLTRHAPSA
ncbi:helix-turn-helix domain-containing protein [Luteimicrobium subarcticum]|uniref:Transcriptional regulator n=1 Tax=Luteimicrobium subarcticum TaxID=620910 RepID=A0A2M8WVW5_9MICO|nr:helix-turn-helix transcriptional regulator [Luteimicrobium subarcticum]PJI95057.1 transcriptional regulator [Luteimicrobium subarcticum]